MSRKPRSDNRYCLPDPLAVLTDEAIIAGTPRDPLRAAWSRRREPNTITFLHGRIPDGY